MFDNILISKPDLNASKLKLVYQFQKEADFVDLLNYSEMIGISIVSRQVCNFTPKKKNHAADEKTVWMDCVLRYALADDQSSAYSMRYVVTSRR